MKIGIFDSGLGGLVIARKIFKKLPGFDYVYLGDTKNLPYGEKSQKQIYLYTKKGVEYLFKKKCELIIIACNTASALALRKLQQNFLPKYFPNRRILGVIIPTLEEADKHHKGRRMGVIATTATINSHIYKKELLKIDKRAKIFEISAPDLVTLIESNDLKKATESLKIYLSSFQKNKVETVILGCTHYPILKSVCSRLLGKQVSIISQDEIIPKKLKEYLNKHPELKRKLTKNRTRRFYVTKKQQNFNQVANTLFGKTLKFKNISY